MNYILLAGVIGLALAVGYIVGRTAEAVRRERVDIEEGYYRLSHIEDVKDEDGEDVRWATFELCDKDEFDALYDKLAQERRNRGE